MFQFFLCSCHLHCHADRLFHGTCVGAALACDVKGGSVPRRGPYDRQTDGDIDCFIKSHHFDRDQSLIVIHRDNAIIVALNGVIKQRICRVWAAAIDPRLLCQQDGRFDDPLLFVAELTVFAGMRIQARGCDMRLGDSEILLQCVIEQINRLENTPDGEFMPNLKERFMNCC